MGRLIGDVCLDMAAYAKERRHEFLSYILNIAAEEAFSGSAASETIDINAADINAARRAHARDVLVGVWDWDISNDRTTMDSGCAEYFGIDPSSAARGRPNSEYQRSVHPDDLPHLLVALEKSIRVGGSFEAEYRLICNDRLRWVYARGHCIFDRLDRPVRMPGAVIDITREKMMS